MAMILKPKPNHPNGSVSKSQEEIKEKQKQEVSKRIGKIAGISILDLRGITLKGPK